jgi:hypothetical protein
MRKVIGGLLAGAFVFSLLAPVGVIAAESVTKPLYTISKATESKKRVRVGGHRKVLATVDVKAARRLSVDNVRLVFKQNGSAATGTIVKNVVIKNQDGKIIAGPSDVWTNRKNNIVRFSRDFYIPRGKSQLIVYGTPIHLEDGDEVTTKMFIDFKKKRDGRDVRVDLQTVKAFTN